MNNNKRIQIIITLFVIILPWSYFLWKVTNNVDNNKIGKIEVKKEYRNIWTYNIQEFKEKINQDYILIDLRTPWELANWYIEWKDLNIDYYKDNFKSEIEKLDRSRKYLIYCHSGSRSWNTLYLMKNLWFKNVHDLAWWISAWERSGEKIEK
jgi:rhodanese-related sulfurtransferase